MSNPMKLDPLLKGDSIYEQNMAQACELMAKDVQRFIRLSTTINKLRSAKNVADAIARRDEFLKAMNEHPDNIVLLTAAADVGFQTIGARLIGRSVAGG